MIQLISVLVFILSAYFVYLLFSTIFVERINITSRLDLIKKIGQERRQVDDLDKNVYQRIFIPIKNELIKVISRITPNGVRNKLEQKINAAGKPFNWESDQWLLVKIFGMILPAIFLVGIMVIKQKIMANVILFGIGAIVFFYFLPELLLRQAVEKRKKEIERDLPDVLDLLTVSVEAGLSFEGSVTRLTEKMKSVISDEFKRTLHEMKVGKTRKEAYTNMSNRCNVPDLSLFISSLIQADELGVGISNVLRVQSEQMRERRRQRAQEKAMKAPIKILFPLLIFIFPTIFVIILGPTVIRVMDMMTK